LRLIETVGKKSKAKAKAKAGWRREVKGQKIKKRPSF
jgi:hypothetical protein